MLFSSRRKSFFHRILNLIVPPTRRLDLEQIASKREPPLGASPRSTELTERAQLGDQSFSRFLSFSSLARPSV